MAAHISFEALAEAAHHEGFFVAGVFEGNELGEEVTKRLHSWISAGCMGEMQYLADTSPEGIARRVTLPHDKDATNLHSLVLFGVRYEQGAHPDKEGPYGKVARYAWGKDYHRHIPKALKRIIHALNLGDTVNFRVSADATPLMERAFAERAGIGFVGKNTLIITPQYGSLFLIGSIYWNVSVSRQQKNTRGRLSAILPQIPVATAQCGTCTRCLDQCPTKAIVAPYTVDARRCISYLTIELRRGFTDEEKSMIGPWIFGCDICQEVCPHNHTAIKLAPAPLLRELSSDRGCGPLLDLREIFAITTDEQFLNRFKGTPLMRAKRIGLLRNALCVAANTARYELIEDIRAVMARESHDIIQDTASWALRTLCQNH